MRLAAVIATLELDAAANDYTAGDWLPVVYDIAGPMLHSIRLDKEPPTIVEVTHSAISWLSRAVAELDRGSAESATSLAETLARLLATWMFASAARDRGECD